MEGTPKKIKNNKLKIKKMAKKVKEKPLTQIQKLRLASPQRKDEHLGAWDRRLWAKFKSDNLEKAHKERELKNRKAKVPNDFWDNFAVQLFMLPFYFLEGIFNKVLDRIAADKFAEGQGKVVYITKEDELHGTNGYLKIINDNGVIILFARLRVIKKVILCIKLKGSKADKAKRLFDIITACGVGGLVTTLPATIAALLLLVPLYSNSNPENEETTFNNLYNGVLAVMFTYQNYCNANPTNALVCAAQGNFDVKVQTPRKKQALTIANNAVQGTIDVTAGGGPARSAHIWKISFDGIVFDYYSTTLVAHLQVNGLAGGIEVWFLHELITTDGPQGYDLMLNVTVAR